METTETKNVFGVQESAKFARNVDIAIQNNGYTRGRLFVEYAQKNIRTGGDLLDYGCGPGRIALMLTKAGYRVHGVDTSAEMIGEAKKLDPQGSSLGFSVGNDQELPSGVYDGIVCSSVIDYVPDPDALLQSFRRALKPNGSLVISHGNSYSLFRWYWTNSKRVYNPFLDALHHHWSAAKFADLLKRNGFQTTLKPKYFDPTYEHRVGPLLLRFPFIGALSIISASRT